ncbi:MAG: hypothetical protein ACQ5SW_06525 [Sphaerochaetaceae bacterium]
MANSDHKKNPSKPEKGNDKNKQHIWKERGRNRIIINKEKPEGKPNVPNPSK